MKLFCHKYVSDVLFYSFYLQNDLYHTIEALTRIAHSRQNSEGYVMHVPRFVQRVVEY